MEAAAAFAIRTTAARRRTSRDKSSPDNPTPHVNADGAQPDQAGGSAILDRKQARAGRSQKLHSTLNFTQPPANTHQQKTPVLEKLRWFTLNRVTGKLKDPANRKERERNLPKASEQRSNEEKRKRNSYHRDAQRMERAIDRMFMTLLISVDPFLHRRIAENEVGVAHVEMGELAYGRAKTRIRKTLCLLLRLGGVRK